MYKAEDRHSISLKEVLLDQENKRLEQEIRNLCREKRHLEQYIDILENELELARGRHV